MTSNQTPEQRARDQIDKQLTAAGWHIGDKGANPNRHAGLAIREYQTDVGPVDYALFVDGKPMGVLEAKRPKEGYRLTVHEEQSGAYAAAKLKHLNNDPLPFIYESTGTITRFTDRRDPKPRGREVFSFHRPETLREWTRQSASLRARLHNLPILQPAGLRDAQIAAINKLETSFKAARPKALIQMATGAGKTFTAATFVYRLLKHADAKRVLFLVDTRNLGEQAESEFAKYQPRDDNRKFTELYNVQRLNSGYIAKDSQVCISTIQRLYSILKGEELDESAEETNPAENTWIENELKKKVPVPVAYSAEVPPEQFDFIVIDECHRSIYNIWKQVLDYFDAFLIGLTATPDKRTFAFFDENVVSEYSYEESVADGVNVPYDVYSIETEISKEGAVVKAGWYVDRRDKLTRKKRWQQEDEDTVYQKNNLDRNVVNPSQIRTILKEFRRALEHEIYPNRRDSRGHYEVPKTLIFAKTDSHADDIIRICREVFDEGNEFCKKVTYKIEEDPKTLLARFRNEYHPRIAVTVDMIATGTDVKPLEVLLFMRNVKSAGYFEQMKGRGTRTIGQDDLRKVSATADTKTHFVIVDAIGTTKSRKTASRPLERKRSVPLKDLLDAVTAGHADEDLFLSLANRLIRLDKQLTDPERETARNLAEGKSLKHITRELLDAYNPDAIEARADETAQAELIRSTAATFHGPLNEHLENIRKVHEQIIDSINTDTVLSSGFDTFTREKAEETTAAFRAWMGAHKDDIVALRIFYHQPYRRREITYRMIREVYNILIADKPALAPLHVWNAYAQLELTSGEPSKNALSVLVSLIRFVCDIDDKVTSYGVTVDRNFKKWIFERHSGAGEKFSEEQMNWLRMLKDHVATSFHLEVDDLDYTPFDAQGGRGKMYQLFGEEMDGIISELNETLVV